MKNRTWLERLTRELPGWHVWRSSPPLSNGGSWNAVPAPASATHDEALALPNRLSAQTPQALRTMARERYGWDDHCSTCLTLARECGHRTDELTKY